MIGGIGDPYSGYYRVVAGTNKNNNHYFGTVRARVGYAVDRALFFLTGGLAYGGSGGGNGGAIVNYWDQPQVVTSPDRCSSRAADTPPALGVATAAFNGPIGNPTATWVGGYGGGYGGNSHNGVGWTIGGGVEYAFTNNWTVKLEYLYAQSRQEWE